MPAFPHKILLPELWTNQPRAHMRTQSKQHFHACALCHRDAPCRSSYKADVTRSQPRNGSLASRKGPGKELLPTCNGQEKSSLLRVD